MFVEDVARVVTYATEDVLEPNVGWGVVSISEGKALTDVRSTIGDGEAGLVVGSIMVWYLTDAVWVAKECVKYMTPVSLGEDSSCLRGTEPCDLLHPAIEECWCLSVCV